MLFLNMLLLFWLSLITSGTAALGLVARADSASYGTPALKT